MRIQHFLSFFCRIMKIYVEKIQNIMRLEKTINHVYLGLIFSLKKPGEETPGQIQLSARGRV